MRKQPPIEGVPAERPRCGCCDKPLSPAVRNVTETVALGAPYPERIFMGRVIPGGQNRELRTVRREWYGWNGYGTPGALFCTLRCCERFAAAAFKAGYRKDNPESRVTSESDAERVYAALAKKLGVSPRAVERWLHGESAPRKNRA